MMEGSPGVKKGDKESHSIYSAIQLACRPAVVLRRIIRPPVISLLARGGREVTA